MHALEYHHLHHPSRCFVRHAKGGRRCRKNVVTRAEAVGEGERALVVVGSVNADMVLQVERLPKEGETLAASNLLTFPGGKVSFVCRCKNLSPQLRK